MNHCLKENVLAHGHGDACSDTYDMLYLLC